MPRMVAEEVGVTLARSFLHPHAPARFFVFLPRVVYRRRLREDPSHEHWGFVSHRWPQFLPDSEHFVYVNTPTGSCSDASEMHFASVDGKQDVALTRACGSGIFADGHLIYWRDGNLVAQNFDPRRGLLSGVPAAIVEHAAFEFLFSGDEFSVSADGKLVYVAGEGIKGTQLGWYDRTGKMVGTLGESDQYNDVAISPDGARVVISAVHGTQNEIRVLDARGTRSRITSGGLNLFPAWSADGRQTYFTSNEDGPYDIFVRLRTARR